MVDRHHRIMGIMVTTVEILERPMEKCIFLVRTTVDFGFLLLLKMDEIHIMCDMYMDEAGIPMLVTMSK